MTSHLSYGWTQDNSSMNSIPITSTSESAWLNLEGFDVFDYV